MARPNRSPLRGSVSQNRATVRMRAARSLTPKVFVFRLGALLGSVALVVTLITWLWHVGWPQRQSEHLAAIALNTTQKLHFSVRDIIVMGRQQSTRDALNASLGVTVGTPILSFDPKAAQERISKLPWIASAVVGRRLPDTILVKITERTALARWQNAGHLFVIDTEGKELNEAKAEQFTQLPLVVGTDAALNAKNLLTTLKDYPEIREKMTAAARVGERRWDLYLLPKVIAKMPESDMDDALKRLTELIKDQHILDREILTIDLRLPDRLIVEPARLTPHRPSGDVHL